MTRDKVRAKIRENLSEILDQDDLVVTDHTTAESIPGWDSLVHLKLLVGLEGALGVKFQLSEMNAARNVGELADLISVKLGAS